MTNYAGVHTSPVFDDEDINMLLSLDPVLQDAVESDNSALVRELIDELSPVWAVAGIDHMQAVIDQIGFAGVSYVTQQLLLAAAYKKAAREVVDDVEQNLYEIFVLLSLDQAGAHRAMIK